MSHEKSAPQKESATSGEYSRCPTPCLCAKAARGAKKPLLITPEWKLLPEAIGPDTPPTANAQWLSIRRAHPALGMCRR